MCALLPLFSIPPYFKTTKQKENQNKQKSHKLIHISQAAHSCFCAPKYKYIYTTYNI